MDDGRFKASRERERERQYERERELGRADDDDPSHACLPACLLVCLPACLLSFVLLLDMFGVRCSVFAYCGLSTVRVYCHRLTTCSSSTITSIEEEPRKIHTHTNDMYLERDPGIDRLKRIDRLTD